MYYALVKCNASCLHIICYLCIVGAIRVCCRMSGKDCRTGRTAEWEGLQNMKDCNRPTETAFEFFLTFEYIKFTAKFCPARYGGGGMISFSIIQVHFVSC